MTIEQAKKMDMVDYLSTIGHRPEKISGKSYWYLSPLHEEKTASFKINRALNRWYDFAEGKGGNLVDFGVQYYRSSVSDFLQKLDAPGQSLSQQEQPPVKFRPEDDQNNQIKILSVHQISSYPLVRYLESRRITHQIAAEYLNEVRYRINDKTFYALGFKNDSGGFELRNQNFKASSSPKDTRFIDNGAKELAVFEGFFNFLSYRQIHHKQEHPPSNFLILNSASFFEKSILKMQEHNRVRLYLDNDRTGEKCTLHALALDSRKFSDERKLYQKYGDLNDWLTHIGQMQRQQLRQRP